MAIIDFNVSRVDWFFIGTLTILVCLSTIIKSMVAYRNYKRAKAFMLESQKKVDAHIVAYFKKYPDSVDQLAAFRQAYYEYKTKGKN